MRLGGSTMSSCDMRRPNRVAPALSTRPMHSGSTVGQAAFGQQGALHVEPLELAVVVDPVVVVVGAPALPPPSPPPPAPPVVELVPEVAFTPQAQISTRQRILFDFMLTSCPAWAAELAQHTTARARPGPTLAPPIPVLAAFAVPPVPRA